MCCAFRLLPRLVLLAIVLCAGLLPTPPVPAVSSPQQSDELAGVLPEVRIRRLHLVRPDLILFPMAYEVWC
jgi:hypothetical protein